MSCLPPTIQHGVVMQGMSEAQLSARCQKFPTRRHFGAKRSEEHVKEVIHFQ